jgi:hypothetical protein
MSKGDQGKGVETQVREWLEDMSDAKSDFAFHRYPDARAARGALAAQPSDFLVANKNRKRVFHVEVKETAKMGRLHRSKISQLGALQKFMWAGIIPIVFVFITDENLWCVLEEDDLYPEGDAPVSFALKNLPMYSTHAEILSAYLL